jgi:hypothetical protein
MTWTGFGLIYKESMSEESGGCSQMGFQGLGSLSAGQDCAGTENTTSREAAMPS